MRIEDTVPRANTLVVLSCWKFYSTFIWEATNKQPELRSSLIPEKKKKTRKFNMMIILMARDLAWQNFEM